MSLHSMTGFARHLTQTNQLDWSWELKTVNHKARDIRLRLPAGCEELESHCRKIVSTRIHRGSCQLTLEPITHEGQNCFSLNKAAVKSLKSILLETKDILGEGEIHLDRVLQIRGVLDHSTVDHSSQLLIEMKEKVFESLDNCVAKLVRERLREGVELKPVLQGYFSSMQEQVKQAENSPARSVENLKARISLLISRLGEDKDRFDESRLHQEAVLIAVKSDISEEVERLKVHIDNGLLLLKSSKPVGRKLDFLAQELNREANTICSKSVSQDITDAGLQLKVLVDQMKEQIQNIE